MQCLIHMQITDAGRTTVVLYCLVYSSWLAMSEPHADYGRWKNSCCWLAVSEPHADYRHWKNNCCIVLPCMFPLGLQCLNHVQITDTGRTTFIVLPCMFLLALQCLNHMHITDAGRTTIGLYCPVCFPLGLQCLKYVQVQSLWEKKNKTKQLLFCIILHCTKLYCDRIVLNYLLVL